MQLRTPVVESDGGTEGGGGGASETGGGGETGGGSATGGGGSEAGGGGGGGGSLGGGTGGGSSTDGGGCFDLDGDGFGVGASCQMDCNDADPTIHPGAAERCNNTDDDCNQLTDDNIADLVCGVGECRRTVPACTSGVTQTCTPGTPATEICNGLDEDCDGTPDNDDPAAGACAPRSTPSAPVAMAPNTASLEPSTASPRCPPPSGVTPSTTTATA